MSVNLKNILLDNISISKAVKFDSANHASSNSNDFKTLLENNSNNISFEKQNRKNNYEQKENLDFSKKDIDNKNYENLSEKDKETINSKSDKNEKVDLVSDSKDTKTTVEKEQEDDKLNEVKTNNNIILFYNQDLLNEISKILNISKDEVFNLISEMGISISQLGETENLINFLVNSFEIQNPEELLSIDNIKNIMEEIINIANNVSYKESVSIDSAEELTGIYEFIENLDVQGEFISFTVSTDNKLNLDINTNIQHLNVNNNTQSINLNENSDDFQLGYQNTEDTNIESLEHNILNSKADNKAEEILIENSTVVKSQHSNRDNIENPINKVEVLNKSLSEEGSSNKENLLNSDIKHKEVTNVDSDTNLNFEMDFSKQNLNDFTKQSLNDFGKQNLSDFSKDYDFEIDFNNLQNISISDKFDSIIDNTTLKSEPLKSINSLETITQILDKIKTSVKTDVSEIKLLLKPDFLGEVSLKIATQNGVVTAQFIAENQKVKEVIESNFSQLKDALNEQGIQVSQLDVSLNDNENNPNKDLFQAFEFAKEKSDERIKNIVNKAFEQENSNSQYVDENEIIISNVNYSV